MTRKGTAGRTPQTNIGANESAIDKAVKKTKEAFDSENEATDYEDVKGGDEKQAAKEYSQEVSDEESRDSPNKE